MSIFQSKMDKGIVTYSLTSWKEMKDLFEQPRFNSLSLAYRGQRCESWALTPTITRKLTDNDKFEKSLPRSNQLTIERHLELFRKSILGRRGTNPKELSENELWALGQHHGLETPLLDWTTSPYVATFFAFKTTNLTSERRRAIWILDTSALGLASEALMNVLAENSDKQMHPNEAMREPIEIIRPDSDENERLITQGGLFTKIPFYASLEQWAEKYMPGYLYKVIIPDSERNEILRNLDKMNISDATLFPDLGGASEYCNYMLEIHGNGSMNNTKQNLGHVGVGFDIEDLAD